MHRVILTILGLSAFFLPLPSLIWGWSVWLVSRPRLKSPLWRYVTAFLSLAFVSASGLWFVIAIAYMDGLPENEKLHWYTTSSVPGFFASIFALLLALTGKGPVRLPSALGSFGFAALWFVVAISY
jgi:hypothetical protein